MPTVDEYAFYRESCKTDYALFRRVEQRIKPKSFAGSMRTNSGLIPFDPPKPGQQKIVNVVQPALLAGRSARVDVFKARKGGASTQGVGLLDWLVTLYAFFFAGIVAKDKDTTRYLFEMAKVMASNHTGAGWPGVDRKNDLFVKYANGSSIEVATAGAGSVFRGPTPYAIVASEMAYWKDAATVEEGLLNSIDLSSGLYIRESTSNGREGGDGEHWWNIYQDHVCGRVSFPMVFIAWFDDWENVAVEEHEPKRRAQEELYGMWLEAAKAGDSHLSGRYAEMLNGKHWRFTPYEQDICLTNNLTVEQMRWFDRTLWEKSKASPNVEDRLMSRMQEHASTVEESFVFHGDTTFDLKALEKLRIKRKPMVQGGLEVVTVSKFGEFSKRSPGTEKHGDLQALLMPDARAASREAGRFNEQTARLIRVLDESDVRVWEDRGGDLVTMLFQPESGGMFEVWCPPQKGAIYYAGIDVSVGWGKDSTSVEVFRYFPETGVHEEAAAYENNVVDPTSAVADGMLLLSWYFDPEAVVELNNPGFAYMGELRRRGYPHIWIQRRPGATPGSALVQHYGFVTGGQTRQQLLYLGKRLLGENRIVMHSERTLSQFSAMKRLKGRDDHPEGKTNDRMIAALLACVPTENLEMESVLDPVLPHEVATEVETYKEWDLRRRRAGTADRHMGARYGKF